MKKEKLKFYAIDQSPLYKLSNKKKLYNLLQSNNKLINKEVVSNIFSNINIDKYLFKFSKNNRNFYELKKELKYINKKLFLLFSKIKTPDYLFSKKEKSHIDNAKYHLGNDFLFKLDISSFFPSINKQKVFSYYIKHLKMAPDVANLICKFTVFDNHLSQGLSTSPILSYLVNQEMFNEIYSYIYNKLKMSIYVDDVTFSSNSPISLKKQQNIIKIIESYGYKVKPEKTRYYTKSNHKKVTGVIISKQGNLKIPNKIREKIIKNLRTKDTSINENNFNQSQLGIISFARAIEPKAFNKDFNKLKNIK